MTTLRGRTGTTLALFEGIPTTMPPMDGASTPLAPTSLLGQPLWAPSRERHPSPGSAMMGHCRQGVGEEVGEPLQTVVGPAAADQLQADGQSAAGESDGDADGRMAGEVDGVGQA